VLPGRAATLCGGWGPGQTRAAGSSSATCRGAGCSWDRHDLAGHLYLADADFERRLTELAAAGYVQPLRDGPAGPVSLTEAGQRAFDGLFRARHDTVARLAAGWQPEQHPRLLELLTRLTHQLAAGSETPGPDLDAAAAPRPGA
jgi:DNA-binding MarR family transcriptional regulator